MSKQFYTNSTLRIPLLLLLLGIAYNIQAQTLNSSKSVANITTTGDGTTASQGDVLQYTIIVTNLSALNITSATLFDNIPAGVSYVMGSTTMNGISAADVSGAMPFAITGGLINSPSFGAGILAPNVSATITFRIKVTANGGSISNYATLQGIYNFINFTQGTNTVFTNITADAGCSVVYQCTTIAPENSPGNGFYYRFIKTLDKSNGEGGPILYDGENGPCFDAVSGAIIASRLMDYVAAIAYDKTTNRIYFVNNYASNPAEDLCYVDLNASPVCARQFTGYPLEPNVSYSINRMAFASDGYGYAVTSHGDDLIQFSVSTVTGLPVITQLGPLINDAVNGANDVLGETGGDLFGDGSGKLYLIANSSKLYKINPATRVTTFLGSINPSPASSSNSIAIDPAGNVYIGGSYQDVYKVNLATMGGSSITGGATSNVWTSGDFTSCGFPVLSPALIANKTYRNTRGVPFVVGGDTVEYSIEVTNNGNINASGVKLFDSVPSATVYIPNSTAMNGVAVADVSGGMPFAITGGQFINSTGEQSGIVKPGTGNKIVVTFKAKANADMYVCNQSRITLLDGDGNTIFVNSDDPAQPGSQNATCFYTSGVLAVNSLNFRGSLVNNQSLLKWSLQENENIACYELEYADVPDHFKTTGKITARHEGNKLSDYQFPDKVNTTADNRFYRLKIVQQNGRYTYSGIIFLSLKDVGMQVYPNPFHKEINVQLQLKTAELVKFRLIDFYGKEVYASAQSFTTGYQSVSLTMPAGCRPGMYVLEVSDAKGRLLQQKLLKK
ncbi:MAG: T9SS type A sorting domain-containing protein [Niastella sp.]|uniref:T9SS type A sorting domain-containing protein n=1 Tax=Niastella sp. TaxID=1869183 RepID=UPI00389B1059